MIAYHRRVFAFDHWANTLSLDAVAPVAEKVPRSLAWLNHILGAQRIWLSRVTGEKPPFGVNPTFSPAELAGQLELAHSGWLDYLDTRTDGDTARLVRYTNLKGEPFESALGDILTHLPIHGQHHRGQINADLRAAGLTPPAIDFIHAARIGALD